MILSIKGDIVQDNVKRAVNYLRDWGYPLVGDYFAPLDLHEALDKLPMGDRLEVKINSGGGDVEAGQEIYEELRKRNDVDIEVQSMAASAASIIAMAGPSTISPVGMIMIHNVSTCGVDGNHKDMEKMAEVLRNFDEALAQAYVQKTGREQSEILKLMDKETWLPANRAVELGFIDSIADESQLFAAALNPLNSKYDTILSQYEKAMADQKAKEETKNELLKRIEELGA